MQHLNFLPSFTVLVSYKGLKIQGCYIVTANRVKEVNTCSNCEQLACNFDLFAVSNCEQPQTTGLGTTCLILKIS